MIWQYKVKLIVMLCRLFIKKGNAVKIKCDKYWPNHDQILIANELTIKCTNEELIESGIIHRVFEIKV